MTQSKQHLVLAMLSIFPTVAGAVDTKGLDTKASAQDCLGFTVKDAAPFLGVPVAQVTLPKAKTDQIKLAQAVVAKL
ncbi:MAG: hypothetical protein IPO19_11425 [Rhodoferax sp.]|nr:hypothetical protein [Rhodoferax sp.]MBK9236606.1 hypothetical protein [Rhodoferax sp.]